ncbi:GNAT family N-acetyltransferase [Rhizobiales bacterium Sp-1]|uniref:GNAT family N-acetyltransferase n=1 Tax=Segnochrobactrum spirostomi TaxID=2608987 RepID=A0A6A7Y0R1_9HYPH|nr:GNAT family N-acetyltransferase [Segnochrobactrum spirostomi]
MPIEGMTDLPRDVLACVVTYLETTERPAPASPDPEITFERLLGRDHARFHALFLAVGTPWLWTDRLRMSEAEQIARLDAPNVFAFAVVHAGRDIGLAEIEAVEGDVEIVYFGLAGDATGRGLGRRTMNATLDRAWSLPQTRRVWLHTCTLDHPAALGFYAAMGFRPYKRAVEIFRDPRALGLHPPDAGPTIPRL